MEMKWQPLHAAEHAEADDFSKEERELHAPHFAQPAFTVSDVIAASLSIWPTGASTAFMNSAVGGAWPASGVPVTGTNGTING